MMDLDEAIQSLVDEMEKQAALGHSEHIDNLEQMAEWLKELKTLKVSRKELLNDIDTAIKASNMNDAYSVGLRNGMRVIKSFIDDEKPEYEKCCHEESRLENPNTCGDAISRREALNAITMAEVRWQAVDNVNKLPSVTPQQRTGQWIEDAKTYYEELNKRGLGVDEYTPYFTDDIACSECLAKYSMLDNETQFFKHCPNCGAKMEEAEE